MHMRPVLQADLYDFARVVGVSMWKDELMEYTAPYKDNYPDSYFRLCLLRTKVRWYRGEFMFLCVSDHEDTDWTGEEVIMGYCCYSTTVKTAEKPLRSGWLGNWVEQYALKCQQHYIKLFKLNRSADQVAEQHFRSVINEQAFDPYFATLPERHRTTLQGQYWELELLGTHPDYRRRGVGTSMLQWGFENATKDSVPLILFATVIGEKLYLSTGFKQVTQIKMLPDDANSNATLRELNLGLGRGEGLIWAGMAWEPPTLLSGREEVVAGP